MCEVCPGVYPLDATSTPELLQPKVLPDIAKYPQGTISPHIENHWSSVKPPVLLGLFHSSVDHSLSGPLLPLQGSPFKIAHCTLGQFHDGGKHLCSLKGNPTYGQQMGTQKSLVSSPEKLYLTSKIRWKICSC